MKKSEKKRRLTSMLATLCVLTALALLLSTAGVTLAKYIREDKSSGAAVAKPFYFSSDKLMEDLPYYQLDEPVGDEEVEIVFTLSNFVDKLRRTEGTVHYTYQAADGSGQTISGTQGQGDFSGNSFETTPEICLKIKKSDFLPAGSVTVTAVSTSPYEKTIGASFGFTKVQSGVEYVVTQQENAVVLGLAGGTGEAVTITWPNSLSPDFSNPIFQGAGTGTVTFTAQSGVRYALTFLKNNPETQYSTSDFTVTQN